MLRRIVFAVFSALLIIAPVKSVAFDPMGIPIRAIPPHLEKTCDHYGNRARFMVRSSNPALEVILADSCAAALRSVVVSIHTDPYSAKRAHIYLERLHTLKETVIVINLSRIFGEDAAPRAKPLGSALSDTGPLAKRAATITRTGEYLIARELGVLAAYQDWARVSDFELQAGLTE